MRTSFNFFEIIVEGNVAIVNLNKPEKRNAMDFDFWFELPAVIQEIDNNPNIRVFIIAANGKSFSTGLDVNEFTERYKDTLECKDASQRMKLHKLILEMQKGMDAIYNSNKASIAVVQKHCIGGALDLIAACDIRYCTTDASFSLREIKVAIVADMGSIHRLPPIIGLGNTKELALTGKDIDSEEALKMGLVTKVIPTKEEALKYAKKIALEISENSSFVMEGVKEVMRYAQNKSVEDGLKHVAVWNSSFLMSKDFQNAIDAFGTKKKPEYNQ